MKSDDDIKRDVEEELRSDPDINSTDIAVAVKNGVVTLAGFVRGFGQKRQAEIDAKRVAGVIGLVNAIKVRLPLISRRPDPEIARDVVRAIQLEVPDVIDRIKVSVKDGHVTLEGDVEWNFQRVKAEEAVDKQRGVKDVTNLISLKPQATPTEIKRKIEEALRRSAEIDAQRVIVAADGSEVTLEGNVRSWAEREEAERAAWAMPGVTQVHNRISVSP
jgi:osmotically-inducible protein OsmY